MNPVQRKLIAGLAAMVLVLTGCSGPAAEPPVQPNPPVPEQIQPEEPVPPKEPERVKEQASATISAVGDVLMHLPVIKTGEVGETGEYTFPEMFEKFAPYVEGADYAVANLETTLCGTDNGYAYRGYPRFNCPDGIVDSLKEAGFDLLLTANNHTFDTGTTGFYRTQEVIDDRGLDRIGTNRSLEEEKFLVKDIDGVRVGMLCYTYETEDENSDIKSLNGIPMTAETSPLINTFSYARTEEFYADLSGHLEEMEAAGAEATILFIHWGNEYQLQASQNQKDMAQRICDLGVDVIIGGHPHVVQPVELLHSQTDPEHHTVCLYSMGNIVSNQRREQIPSANGYTEDGVMFSVTFTKYTDGTVLLRDVDVLPTWVNLTTSGETGRKVYEILPLSDGVQDWKTVFDLTDNELHRARDSYERTMGIVGDGLTVADEFLAEQETPEGRLLP